VPNQAVSLERLEWKASPTQPVISEQPAWAAPLEPLPTEPVSPEETVPVWLSARQDIFGQPEMTGEIEEPPVPAEIGPKESEEHITAEAVESSDQPQEEIPDWMMDAGWVPLSAGVAAEILSQDEPVNDQETGK
jgi:hypothetical protein